jgi:hypothetical protein
MRRVVIIPILLGVLLAACATKQPRLSLQTEKLDFGDVINGEVISQEVIVRNEGEAPLVVKEVSTSCGCTQASVEPMVIAPGEAGVLHIEFDSGAHGSELTGELIRQVFLLTNDPERPEVVVEIAARVLPKP